METHGIAAFDVCGTITKTNNTSDFIGFVLARDSAPRYCLFVLLRILCSLFSFAGIRRIFSRDLLRDWQIALLRGYSPARLQEMAELYVNALFARGLLNRRILEAMRQEREQGRAILLVSAAIDPPIAELAGRLNAGGFFSSELQIENGRCTGKLAVDLLGHKQAVLERFPATADLRHSSAYSDNPEDQSFMQSFGSRNAVLNASHAKRMWDAGNGGFRFIVNYDAAEENRDIDSVNGRTARWIYLPLLYYIVSRFHRTGVYSLFLREIIPVTLATWLFTGLGARSFVLIPLSFLMFYCVYEIGGLANDLLAKREPPGTSTRRIAPDVRIHTGLFLSIRVAVVALGLAWLPLDVRFLATYTALLCFCLAIYLIHSAIGSSWRVLTYTLLKLCRTCIPLAILAPHVPAATLAWLCTVFVLMDAPWRVYVYCRWRGLVRGATSVFRARCANVAALLAAGAVIHLIAGSPHLLAIASYYVMLECLWAIRAVLPQSVVRNRSHTDDGQMGKADSSSPPRSRVGEGDPQAVRAWDR